MTRRPSVQQLVVKPLRKLSLLPNNTTAFQPDLEFVPEQQQYTPTEQPTDIVSLFPREVILKVLSLLSFQDLIQVQLTCRVWHQLAQDSSIWRSRLHLLNNQFADIYAHQPCKSIEASSLSWKTRYCQAITFANWRRGTVQKLTKIDDHNGTRILSVKLKEGLLVTLAEDNTVKLFQYSIDHGFMFKSKWFFGDPISQPSCMAECIDILPNINILVVAQRGSKCMFYDISKGSKHDPIQVLRGGSHPWFIPDSISVNQDYFAVAGRKPSAVFVWNWRKGVRLSNRAFDNQPHNVFLSGDNLITVSVDGLLHVFGIFDQMEEATATHYLHPCSIPCIEYDNSLSLVLAPHASRRIHHYRWTQSNPIIPISHNQPIPQLSTSSPTNTATTTTTTTNSTHNSIKSNTRRFSSSFIHHLLNLTSSSKSTTSHPPPKAPHQSASAHTLSASTRDFCKSVRLRRHSSYNDYGYACQMKTDQYIKKHRPLLLPQPNFDISPRLVHSIRTTPLGCASKAIVNVAMYAERIATVNRQGDIALYAMNGTTAARVTLLIHEEQPWMEQDHDEDDDLSDGYDFIRSRLAMGPMGLVYGAKNGVLWWLDFGCRALD